MNLYRVVGGQWLKKFFKKITLPGFVNRARARPNRAAACCAVDNYSRMCKLQLVYEDIQPIRLKDLLRIRLCKIT